MPPFGSIPYVPIPYAGGNATARLADLIRQSGQDRANAAQNSGAIQAYMWGNLGNNLTNTINNIAQIQANAPLKKAQMLEIQARTGELQAQAEARQQQQADTRAIDQAQAPILQGVPVGMTGPPDPSQGNIIPSQEQIIAHLRESGNGHLVAGVQKQFDDAAKAADAVKMSKAQLADLTDKHRQTIVDHLATLRYSLIANGGDPITTAHAFQNALATYGDDPEMLQQINAAKEALGPNPTSEAVLKLAQGLPTTTAWAEKEKALTPPDYTVGNQRFSGKTNQVIATGEPTPKAPTSPTQVDLAIRAAQGDQEAAAALDRLKPPREPRAPVAVMGPDGQAIFVSPDEAVGKRPANQREQGRPVTAGSAEKIAEYDTALDDLGTLGNTLSATKATGAMARLGATYTPNVVTEITGAGAEAKSRQAVIDRVKQVIGKTLEGGVLRKEDEIKYEKILPTIGDPPSVARTKLAGLAVAIKLKRQRDLEALADAGYDTSKFSADYKPITSVKVGRDANGKLVAQ